ncbi:formin-J isoform X1 [Drosophila persimilis]|uniref:formin-J isoform X1 n=2 Tax=Drosophila persimilis TaxID=7234 RepID=UPI000F085B66|nr:formin-J isoform X1 [Drosophila persimilis]
MEGPEQQEVMMLEGSEDLMSTSATSTNGSDTNGCGGRKSSITSPDPTSYVTKARVTKPTPPPPSKNPMQFVQIKPCNLYQTAQQQLKKAEEVKKLKEVQKEEPEEWQNNLDNWKSSRRKRVEHIIDRVVETKKLELEEHDRTRRKSKTFTEMMEERAERGGSRARVKLASLAVYNEDEANDLSDLGIGTSSASGKSSLSEDYDNNSVMSDNAAELDKAIGGAGSGSGSGAACASGGSVEEQQNHINSNGSNGNSGASGQATTSKANASKAASAGGLREYISSPGYDTSSSTAPASSPDPCEYTYEGAIQDYKQRVQRASSNGNGNGNANGKMSTSPSSNGETIAYPTRRGSKIEDRLSGFEVTSPSDTQEGVEKQKVDVPKVDISKRKEIFEQAKSGATNGAGVGAGAGAPSAAPKVVLRDRLTNGNSGASNGSKPQAKQEIKRLSGDISSIRDRMQSLEQQRNAFNHSKSVDVPVPPLKQRLNSLQQSVTKEDQQKKPPLVALIDARQLEIMRGEEERMRQQQQQQQHQNQNQKQKQQQTPVAAPPPPALVVEEAPATAAGTGTNDDSGIQEDTNEELQQQQLQLNAAIAALAIEERQLEEAANAVNQIEAEFDELTDLNPSPLPHQQPQQQPQPQPQVQSPCAASAAAPAPAPSAAPTQAAAPPLRDMEFSINEALELALEAIDREATTSTITSRKMEKPQQQQECEEQAKEDVQEEQLEQEVEEQRHQHQQQEEEEEEIDPREEEVEGETTTEMPNKTDEQKRKEERGEREPIYENVSSTISMHEVDNEQIATMTISTQIQTQIQTQTPIQGTQASTRRSHRRSIPNKQTSNSNNNENNQNTNQNSNSNSNGNSNQNENSIGGTAALSSDPEPYYQVPKATEPYYDAPKHLRPIPVYENIDIFYTGLELSQISGSMPVGSMEPPKEKPPPPPTESPPPVPVDDAPLGHDDELDGLGSSLGHNTDTWSSDNTYETISNGTRRHMQSSQLEPAQPSPPIKRMNSTKRIKKELRNKRSSFLGIETDGDLDDVESYLELTVAPPPDMAQLLQEERRLEKQLYIKAGLCDSSDTGDSRDSGVSENHSRQSSEHYTNSSEENDTQSEATPPPLPPPPVSGLGSEIIYQNETLLAAQTPLLQTVKGNSAESWTESATAAAAATQSLSEATATANAKMQSIEEKIREQGEVLRVERELLHFSQEELKRQRENLLLRENIARRELQHGAKMLMSNNRRSLQDLHHGLGIGNGMLSAFQPPQHQQQPQQQLHPHQPHPQQIYANVPQQQQQQQQQQVAAMYAYQQMDTDYRKSMSDLNEFSSRLMLAPPKPPTKPLRAMHISNGHGLEPDYAVSTRQRQSSANAYGGSLVKIAGAPMPPRHSGSGYPPAVTASAAAAYHHQSAQNLSNMSRNTLLALSATPKPKYTDGWVQVQQRKSYDSNLANDPAWLSAQQQKRKSMPDYNGAIYNNNHWLLQEAEQRRIEQLNRRSMPGIKSNGKPLPDSIIQTLTERVQSKGIGERKRFDGNGNYSQVNGNTNGYQQQQQQKQSIISSNKSTATNTISTNNTSNTNSGSQEKVLSVSGKKKCSHCGDELGRGAAMIIESLLLFYHINCFKCCVCHVQLGDGLNGTDVRVRNHKLHCQNCYSSDDGIKFSCV